MMIGISSVKWGRKRLTIGPTPVRPSSQDWRKNKLGLSRPSRCALSLVIRSCFRYNPASISLWKYNAAPQIPMNGISPIPNLMGAPTSAGNRISVRSTRTASAIRAFLGCGSRTNYHKKAFFLSCRIVRALLRQSSSAFGNCPAGADIITVHPCSVHASLKAIPHRQ